MIKNTQNDLLQHYKNYLFFVFEKMTQDIQDLTTQDLHPQTIGRIKQNILHRYQLFFSNVLEFIQLILSDFFPSNIELIAIDQKIRSFHDQYLKLLTKYKNENHVLAIEFYPKMVAEYYPELKKLTKFAEKID